MKKFFGFIILVLILFPLLTKNAAADVTLTYAPPCLVPSDVVACPDVGDSIANYLLRLYNFALGIVGTIAFGSIVVGGIYIAFSGIADKKKEGKDMITSALWGIAILLGSYLILNTVNPQITKLREPTISKLKDFGKSVGLPNLNNLADLAKSDNIQALMIACGVKNSAGGTFFAQTACSNPKEWPFVKLNVEGAVILKDDGSPDYECENASDMILDGDIQNASYNRICQPENLNTLATNRPTVYTVFYGQGVLSYRIKLANNECLDCISSENLPVKSNQDCSLINDEMASCVCTLSIDTKSEPPTCKLNRPLLRKLVTFKQRIGNEMDADWQNKWRITEAWPPTVNHQEDCHFNGQCFDLGIETDRCDIINTFVLKAKEVFGADKVLNEYIDCGGAGTQNTTGGHLHIKS